ncbi:MAG TPA: AI-2E family transporter [Methylomirabilota bacterium]
MTDLSRALAPWAMFGGFVLVVAVLYWAQAVLMPVAVALLLTFLLTPAVTWLQRWIGRMAAIFTVVLLVFVGLGAAGWGVARQLSGLADDLPAYRTNIRQKIADVRGASRGSSVEKVQETLEEIQEEIESDGPRGTAARPVIVESAPVAGPWGFPAWLTPLFEPLATAGLVIALVMFMLLERQELRDRLIGLIGHGHLTVTTRAFDEAASRVSRYLLMQSLVNLTYGIGVAIGLYLLGVPYYLLWAMMGAALRFIPYVGPMAAAGAPILVSLAALPGWTEPLYVVGLFIGLELFTNMVMETVLYAGAAGVSQVALLVAVAFWTWLWGAMGLLLATPLTVCLVVLGKHVPGLKFIATLMADEPPLSAEVSYYQRLLARDEGEAAEIVERYIKDADDPATVFDAILLPALNAAERDRLEGRLSMDEEAAVVELTRELIDDAAGFVRGIREPGAAASAAGAAPPELQRVPVLAYAAASEADVQSLRMLEQLMRDEPVSFDITSARALSSELVETVIERGYRIVCIADLPPSPPSKSRYLVRKLRAARPDLKIVVGRWAPPTLAGEDSQVLIDAGADDVGSTLLGTCEQLRQLVHLVRLSREPGKEVRQVVKAPEPSDEAPASEVVPEPLEAPATVPHP